MLREAPVTIHQAKTHFSELVRRCESGEEFVIARGRKVVARLVPAEPSSRVGRRFGALKGLVTVEAEFFEPLSEAELARWGH